MATVSRPRYVDVGNPALGIPCPRCGLRTARFMEFCNNCGYALWPSVASASRAFEVWRDHDPSRAAARPFDVSLTPDEIVPVVDFQARAHELGIHVFPGSNWPFPICLGMLFLGLALIPFPSGPRLVMGIIGGLIFLYGVGGWVMVEDVKIYPSTDPAHGEVPKH